MTRLTSDTFKIGQFFMSIRNYDSTQRNYRKNLSSKLARKSNLKIINIFGREILNSGSGRKKLSKTHRPKTGVAAPWELNRLGIFEIQKIFFYIVLSLFTQVCDLIIIVWFTCGGTQNFRISTLVFCDDTSLSRIFFLRSSFLLAFGQIWNF